MTPTILTLCLTFAPVQYDVPAASAAPPAVAQTNGPATLLVDRPIAKDGITLGLADLLTVTVQVEANALEVKPPPKVSRSPGWRLSRASAPINTELSDGRRLWSQTYVFEPLMPGELSLQIEPLDIRADGEPFRSLSWKPLAVHAVTTITTPDLKDLRDPTVIESVPQPEPASAEWLWLAGSGMLLAALLLIVIRRLRRPRKVPLSAQQRVQRQLDRLRALGLPDKGKAVAFHMMLANIVRRYLGKKLQLPARHRTSAEFMQDLRGSQKLTEQQQELLHEFFAACDLAKFAGMNGSSEECAALAERIQVLIRDIAPGEISPEISHGERGT